MPRITVELLRRRAEHNECIVSTLEEISLHQEELEKIEVIGTLCRRLRILYLQNNIIEKIEDLTHMKELRYLNLALNNISKIEGLHACEFLEKLDLTVNFVDFDELEDSIDHLKPLRHLGELYMLGNPCQSNWAEDGFREYAIASLPQLRLLDGKEVQRSDRIKALQVFAERQRYVREKAVRVRAEKARERQRKEQELRKDGAEETESNQLQHEEGVIDVVDDGEATDISASTKQKKMLGSEEKVPYTPETRREMYLELAEQKEEEEERRRENQPRERNMEAEHAEALRRARHQEEDDKNGTSIRQCNEGKWDFRIFDEDLQIVLEVDLPRFLDSSLVDVDVHPAYVSIVIKNKLFRLRFPELVHSDQGKAERSKVTGTLKLSLPKASVTLTQQLRAQLKREEVARKIEDKRKNSTVAKAERTRRFTGQSNKKLSDELLEAAQTVSIGGIVKMGNETNATGTPRKSVLTPIATKTQQPETGDEEAPPLLY